MTWAPHQLTPTTSFFREAGASMHGVPWEPCDIKFLIKSRKDGMTMAKIAKHLGRTLLAVNTRAQMLGLPFHIPKTRRSSPIVPAKPVTLPFHQRVRMADLIIGDEGIIICDTEDRERILKCSTT